MVTKIEEVKKTAVELFNYPLVNDRFVETNGKIENPIPILDTAGNIHSWFVGITSNKRLAGFMQIDNDLNLLRYSSFQRIPNSIEGCPEADTWLSPKKILTLAKTKAGKGDSLSNPTLTYDQNPSRIVWSVIARNKNGKTRTIYVAGEYVYVAGN